MTARRRPLDDEQYAGPEWGTEEAAELFAKVRGLCGVSVIPDFAANVATALQEAREILAREGNLDDEVAKINPVEHGAARCAIEALMLSLRERGLAALEEPAVRRRLAQLSEQQLFEVGDRLQRLKPEIARAWTAREVKQLLRSRSWQASLTREFSLPKSAPKRLPKRRTRNRRHRAH
jgi:hypothetical protein